MIVFIALSFNTTATVVLNQSQTWLHQVDDLILLRGDSTTHETILNWRASDEVIGADLSVNLASRNLLGLSFAQNFLRTTFVPDPIVSSPQAPSRMAPDSIHEPHGASKHHCHQPIVFSAGLWWENGTIFSTCQTLALIFGHLWSRRNGIFE